MLEDKVELDGRAERDVEVGDGPSWEMGVKVQ